MFPDNISTQRESTQTQQYQFIVNKTKHFEYIIKLNLGSNAVHVAREDNGRTSRGHTGEEGHTGFLIHLPSAVRAFVFFARRIQPFLSLVDREVEVCVLTI